MPHPDRPEPAANQGNERGEPRDALFVQLITANHDHLRRYIYTLLPHEQDAQDVMQEVCLTMSRKFSEYDRSRPFFPWACGFAYLKVLQHRDRLDRFAMVERVPERTQSTTCSAVALLLLGDLLGSLLLLLRHCDGSLPRAPALLHDHSPGCSVGGNGRRCASRRSEPNTALRRCMTTLHRAAQKSCEG